MTLVLKRALACLAMLLTGGGFWAHAANIAWVNEDRGGGGGDAGVGMGGLDWADDQWRALMEGAGHTIIAHGDPYFLDIDLEPDRLDLLNSADLVIVARDSNSGEYNTTEEEIQLWTEGITVPMLVMTPFHLRSSRWRMADTTATPLAENPLLALDPAHPVFQGVQLDANNEVDVWDDTLLGPDDNINLTDDWGNGTVLAEDALGDAWIVYWEEGVEFYDGSDTYAGAPRMFFGGGSDDDPNTWGEKNLTPAGDQIFLNAINFLAGVDQAPVLKAGDANQDLEFNQLDLVQVQIAAKYLSGQAATWGEGDWDGAPGGEVGSPPTGNGFFDQLDIIAALAAGTYLTGPYAALAPGEGVEGDEQTSIVYDPATGALGVDAPASTNLTSINIDSASGIFTGDPAENLGGSFDNDADNNIFKATFGSSFGSLSFGNVAQAGLSKDFVLQDLTAVGSLAGGGDLGAVDLIYVPEPASVVLSLLGFVGLITICRRRA